MKKLILSFALVAMFAIPSMEANAVVCPPPIPGVYGLVGLPLRLFRSREL